MCLSADQSGEPPSLAQVIRAVAEELRNTQRAYDQAESELREYMATEMCTARRTSAGVLPSEVTAWAMALERVAEALEAKEDGER